MNKKTKNPPVELPTPKVTHLPPDFQDMLEKGGKLRQPSQENLEKALLELGHTNIRNMVQSLFSFFEENLPELKEHLDQGGVYAKLHMLSTIILWEMSKSIKHENTSSLKPKSLKETKKEMQDTVETAKKLKEQLETLATDRVFTELKLLTFLKNIPESEKTHKPGEPLASEGKTKPEGSAKSAGAIRQMNQMDDIMNVLPECLSYFADCLQKIADNISPERGKARPRSFTKQIIESLCEIYNKITGEIPEIKRNGEALSTNNEHRFTCLYKEFIDKFEKITWPNSQTAKKIVEEFFSKNP